MKLNRLKQIIKEEFLQEIKVEPPVGVAKSPFFTEDGDFLFFNLTHNKFSPSFENIYMMGTNLSAPPPNNPDVKLESIFACSFSCWDLKFAIKFLSILPWTSLAVLIAW